GTDRYPRRDDGGQRLLPDDAVLLLLLRGDPRARASGRRREASPLMRPNGTLAARPVRDFAWLGERVAAVDTRAVLGGLVLLQWLTLVVFAFVVRHNGWVFYQGGDETFHYSSAWAIAHGHVPESEIGFGW